MPKIIKSVCLLALAHFLSPVHSQETTSISTSAPTSPLACASPCLRAGSIVELELMEPMSSLRHHRGDAYKLRTVSPIIVDGETLVPAGTEAVGAVVHANKSRSGGQAGELLLAARSMQVGGATVPLKGMKLGASGQDKSNDALVASFVIGPFAMFMRGREIEIPANTRAHAKVAADISFAPAMAGESAPSQPLHPIPAATPSN